MSSDTLADMLSQIKNASAARLVSVELPYSKTKEGILKVLEDVGFVKDVKVFKESGNPYKSLHVGIIYEGGKGKIRDIRRVSKPGRRVYAPSSDIKHVNAKHGVIVVSTPQGIMSGTEARKRNLGGELLCEVS